MATMRAPFQRLLFSACKDSAAPRLIGASGGSLNVFDASSGKALSRWTDSDSGGETERPAKRRKTNDSHPEKGDTPRAQSREGRNHNGNQRDRGQTKPFITNLVGTSDGRNLVATTAEDKLVYVFALSPDGVISQLSKRHGDVYSLPLIWDQNEWAAGKADRPKSPERRRRLAADHTTVHSKKNLRALESQQKLKDNSDAKPKEPTMDFEHKLLLGHVSMLTDVVTAEIEVSGQNRQFILTSDRDEHIRVSRGPPQSYVIEAFLLEHEELVNKLHIPCWDPRTLISGGGDNDLLVWDWRENKIRQRLNFQPHIAASRLSDVKNEIIAEVHEADGTKVMIVGIWSMDTAGCQMLLVSSEAYGISLAQLWALLTNLSVPALIVYRRMDNSTLEHVQTLCTECNVLDLASLGHNLIIVSVDHLHRPWTRDQPCPDDGGGAAMFVVFQYDNAQEQWTRLEESSLASTLATEVRGEAFDEILDTRKLEGLFYGCEHLRKKRSGEPEAASDHGDKESVVDK